MKNQGGEWVQNLEGWLVDRFNIVGGYIGAPKETEYYTREKMIHDGYVGVYRLPGREGRKFSITKKTF